MKTEKQTWTTLQTPQGNILDLQWHDYKNRPPVVGSRTAFDHLILAVYEKEEVIYFLQRECIRHKSRHFEDKEIVWWLEKKENEELWKASCYPYHGFPNESGRGTAGIYVEQASVDQIIALDEWCDRYKEKWWISEAPPVPFRLKWTSNRFYWHPQEYHSYTMPESMIYHVDLSPVDLIFSKSDCFVSSLPIELNIRVEKIKGKNRLTSCWCNQQSILYLPTKTSWESSGMTGTLNLDLTSPNLMIKSFIPLLSNVEWKYRATDINCVDPQAYREESLWRDFNPNAYVNPVREWQQQRVIR